MFPPCIIGGLLGGLELDLFLLRVILGFLSVRLLLVERLLLISDLLLQRELLAARILTWPWFDTAPTVVAPRSTYSCGTPASTSIWTVAVPLLMFLVTSTICGPLLPPPCCSPGTMPCSPSAGLRQIPGVAASSAG